MRERGLKFAGKLLRAGVMALASLLLAHGAPVQAREMLVELARPGPWPGVSRLIAFAGGIWLVNSDPFANFNAADIYRYTPASRTARYERGLFSQDAGTPAVFRGRLYWPFEDPRSNAAVGEFAVTDGETWRWEVMNAGITLHVHAMAPCRGGMLAAAGGWNGALQASPDGLGKWREIHRLPENAEGFSRITALGSLGERCFFASSDAGHSGQRLHEWTDTGARVVAGWPEAVRVSSLTAYRGGLVAVNHAADGTTLWRLDGDGPAERLAAPGDGVIEALGASEERLYALTSDRTGGALWESADGHVWTRLQRFAEERPIALLVVGDDLYVGTYRAGGGALYGPAQPSEPAPGPPAAALGEHVAQTMEKEVVETSMRTLETALAPKPDYMTYRASLLGVALPLAETRDKLAGVVLAKRARKPLPAGEILTSTEQTYTVETLARWLLLYAAGLTGAGYVPTEWLSLPWAAAARPSEKYFETSLAAIRASGRFRQNAPETIDALLARLDNKSDPAWLAGDIIAALTQITDQHFGYDVTAWKSWWAEARRSWPPEPTQGN